jgi:hypothetical protein
VGRDGCFRDLASIHGTYRHVQETEPALSLIIAEVARLQPRHVDWYLDRPVSNSGRLKTHLAGMLQSLEERTDAETVSTSPTWNVELVNSPDRQLTVYGEGVVVTSDSVVIDRCAGWFNLAASLVSQIAHAWIVNLTQETTRDA